MTIPNARTPLGEYVERYKLERDLSSHYQVSLSQAVRMFERWHGKPITIGELEVELFNRWITHLKDEGKSPRTIKNYRAGILALWRNAYEDRITDTEPKRIKRIRTVRKIPQAWTQEDIAKLLDAAAKVPNYFPKNGIKRSLYWVALIRTLYDTALRLCDCLTIRRDQIEADGSLRVVQSKTGFEQLCRLRPSTVASIEATFPPDRELVFPWGHKRDWMYQHFRAIAVDAGVYLHADGIRRIRRASASYVERDYPGMGARHLGHRTPGLAQAHYFDPSIIGDDPIMPPPLPGDLDGPDRPDNPDVLPMRRGARA